MKLIRILFFIFLFGFSIGSDASDCDSLKMIELVDSIHYVYEQNGLSHSGIKEAFDEVNGFFQGDCREYLEIEEQYILAYNFMDYGLYDFAWRYAEEIASKSKKIKYQAGVYGVYGLYANLHYLSDEHDEANKYADENLDFWSDQTDLDSWIEALLTKSMVETDSTKVFQYLHEALALAEEIKDTSSLNFIYSNLTFQFLKLHLLDSAAFYSQKDFETTRVLNTSKAYAYSYWLKGNLSVLQKDFESAEKYFEQALEVGEDSAINLSLNSLNNLVRLSENKKVYEKALGLVKRRIHFTEKNTERSTEELKQIFEDVSKLNREKITQNANIQLLEASEFQFKLVICFTSILILVLVGFVIQQLRTRKLLEYKNAKISASENEIALKNKALTDSIIYAKRIQNSILPADDLLQAILTEHFVLFLPKDIVSGDFYWLNKSAETVLFAVADCTGHGVPGALVSVVCYNSLNKSVDEFGLSKTSDILNQTRELIIEEFDKADESVSDGMDIALCALDRNGLLRFSGANSSLFIVRNGEVLEFKADKMPVGKFPNTSDFKEVEITLEDGDIIYLFSDGFSDQFGGDRGKKLKKSKFKNLLLSAQGKSLDGQKYFLENALMEWKGKYDQVDDICVMGVKFVSNSTSTSILDSLE